MITNPAISNVYTWNTNSISPTTRVNVKDEAKYLFPVGVYTTNALALESSKVIGNVPLKLTKALRTMESTETFDLDVVIDAGLSTIYSFTEYQSAASFNDEISINEIDEIKDNWSVVANTLITFAESNRKDCMAIIDPPRSIFVSGRDSKTLTIEGKNFTSDIYNPLRTCVDPIESNYAALYANWIKVNDLYSGKKVWNPFSGNAAAVFARTDAVSYPWIAPAGLNRASFSNALDIAINPNQKQRDRLYEIAVNPVVFFNSTGFCIFGQKTLQNKPTAFDRINVRRLFLALERAVSQTMKSFVFEPNTEFTRNRIISTIAPIFSTAKNTDGLYDYLLVCDERNNTPQTIDNNELILDIYLKPARAAEFILINFIATRTGQNFQELI